MIRQNQLGKGSKLKLIIFMEFSKGEGGVQNNLQQKIVKKKTFKLFKVVWIMKKKKSNKKCLPNFYPPHTHTKKAKSWGYADFKMAANENALTQPRFELGICGIIYIFVHYCTNSGSEQMIT